MPEWSIHIVVGTEVVLPPSLSIAICKIDHIRVTNIAHLENQHVKVPHQLNMNICMVDVRLVNELGWYENAHYIMYYMSWTKKKGPKRFF